MFKISQHNINIPYTKYSTFLNNISSYNNIIYSYKNIEVKLPDKKIDIIKNNYIDTYA